MQCPDLSYRKGEIIPLQSNSKKASRPDHMQIPAALSEILQACYSSGA